MDARRRGARFVLGLVVVFGALAFVVVRPFATWIALGLVGAYLARWPQRKLAERLRPGFAAAIVVVLVLLLVVAPFAAVGAFVVDDLVRAAKGFGSWRLETELSLFLWRLGVPGEYIGAAADLVLAKAQAFATAWAERALAGAFELFVGVFVLFFVLYYGLVEGRGFVTWLRRAAPIDDARVGRFLDEAGRSLDAVFRGGILVALVQGTIAGIGWWAFGLPDPFFWGFVMMLLSILPWTGPPLVIVPAGVWLALEGEVARGVGFAAFGLVLVGGIDNVLRPWLIGRGGEIHPALVLVGVVGGLASFGLAGLFLGPLALVLFRAALLAWAERERGAETPTGPGQ